METLWNIEDKLKISTKKAIVLLICTTVLVIVACLTIMLVVLKKKGAQRTRIACHDYSDDDDETESMIMYETRSQRCSSKCGLLMRNALMGSPCWSVAHKWNDHDGVVLGGRSASSSSWNSSSWSCVREQRIKLVSSCMQCGGGGGCVGRSRLPVWQRPILMGEKCELPRFSGLILYDERGRPLPHHHFHHQFSTVSPSFQGETEDYRTTTTTKNMLIDLSYEELRTV